MYSLGIIIYPNTSLYAHIKFSQTIIIFITEFSPLLLLLSLLFLSYLFFQRGLFISQCLLSFFLQNSFFILILLAYPPCLSTPLRTPNKRKESPKRKCSSENSPPQSKGLGYLSLAFVNHPPIHPSALPLRALTSGVRSQHHPNHPPQRNSANMQASKRSQRSKEILV